MVVCRRVVVVDLVWGNGVRFMCVWFFCLGV